MYLKLYCFKFIFIALRILTTMIHIIFSHLVHPSNIYHQCKIVAQVMKSMMTNCAQHENLRFTESPKAVGNHPKDFTLLHLRLKLIYLFSNSEQGQHRVPKYIAHRAATASAMHRKLYLPSQSYSFE